jgi:hypothetical protein
MSITYMPLPAPVGATTADVGPRVRIVALWSRAFSVDEGTTDAHVQAMHDLAALSFDPHSLDRDLEDEINRNAWGISGT